MKYFITLIIVFIFIGCGSSNIVNKNDTKPPQPKVTEEGIKPPASPEL